MRFRSIRVRLIAWYLLMLALGLGLFGIGSWFAMRASAFDTIDEELEGRICGVGKFTELQIAALSPVEIRDESREHSVLGFGGDLFQVCNEKGEWLYGQQCSKTARSLSGCPIRLETDRRMRTLRFKERRCDLQQVGSSSTAILTQFKSRTNPEYPAPIVVRGDGQALRRLFFILIDNAIKYTPEGGRVQINLKARDGHASITVEDKGVGIAESDQSHIFDRFWSPLQQWDLHRSRGCQTSDSGRSAVYGARTRCDPEAWAARA